MSTGNDVEVGQEDAATGFHRRPGRNLLIEPSSATGPQCMTGWIPQRMDVLGSKSDSRHVPGTARSPSRPKVPAPAAKHGRRPEGQPSTQGPYVRAVTTPLKFRHSVLCPQAHSSLSDPGPHLGSIVVTVPRPETAVAQCPGGPAGVHSGLTGPMHVPGCSLSVYVGSSTVRGPGPGQQLPEGRCPRCAVCQACKAPSVQ